MDVDKEMRDFFNFSFYYLEVVLFDMFYVGMDLMGLFDVF